MTTLVFQIPSKDILNSNALPNNRFVKGARARALRTMGQLKGVENHSNPEHSQKFLEHIKAKSELKTAKARLHKSLKKNGLSAEEIEKELSLLEENAVVPDPPKEMFPMVNRFNIQVLVQPPTKRKIDPANLYPTVKPIIDGLTDSGWWEDDDFNHLEEISFRYGGVSGISGEFLISLTISEVKA